jgi:hypothetical protein
MKRKYPLLPLPPVRGRQLPSFCCAIAILLLLIAMPVGAQQQTLTTDEDESTRVRAGEPFAFKVHLDDSPSAGGRIMYRAPSPGRAYFGGGGPDSFCAMTVSQQQDYDCTLTTDKTLTGSWPGEISDFQVQYPDKIVRLELKPIRYIVIGLPPIPVTTQTARVTVLPTQQQLLRTDGARLQRRIADLKAAVLGNRGAGALITLLRSNVDNELAVLRSTERDFEILSNDPQQKQVATIFFGDLRDSYQAALRQIPAPSGADLIDHQLLFVAQDNKQGSKDYPPVAQTAFRAMEQNELAFTVVADSGRMSFDLEVSSTPAGAKISYSRHGDRQPNSYQDLTNCTIHSLPFAIWIVRFEKDGYPSEEREHDPFHASNNTLHVDFKK